MQDATFCDPSIHAAEGVHFSMAGYTLMWQKAAKEAGFPIVVASAGAPKMATSGGHTGHKRHGKKKRHKRKSAAAETAPPPSPAPN